MHSARDTMSQLSRSASETERIQRNPMEHKRLSEKASRLSEQGFPLDPYVWGPFVWLLSPFICIGLFLLLLYVVRPLMPVPFRLLGHF